MATLISFIRENMEESVCVFCGLSCIGYLTYQSFFVDDGVNGRCGGVRAALRNGRNAFDRILLREIRGITR